MKVESKEISREGEAAENPEIPTLREFLDSIVMIPANPREKNGE